MELQGRTAGDWRRLGYWGGRRDLLAEQASGGLVWAIESGADVQVDVTSEESIAKAMRETVSRWGTPSLLVGVRRRRERGPS